MEGEGRVKIIAYCIRTTACTAYVYNHYNKGYITRSIKHRFERKTKPESQKERWRSKG